MKVLVTGATGIVGANLVRALLRSGHRVRVLIRRSSDRRSLDGLQVQYCEGDVLEADGLADAVEDCRVVYHAAAVFSYWGQSASEQRELAVCGTRNVLAAARAADVRRVVVTSSSVVLGSTSVRQVLDESTAVKEPEPPAYAVSKIDQENAAFETGARLGLDVVAVCPTLVIGAHDYKLSPSNANIVNYLNDPFRSTFIGGCNIVSAGDVAAGHILAAERGLAGCRYVLGSENLTWQALHGMISELSGTFGPELLLNHTSSYLAAAAAETWARLAGRRPMVTREEAKMSARFYWYSHSLMAGLGYAPAPARGALTEAIAWLILRSYINDSVRAKLRLAPEVMAAQARLAKEATA